MKVSGRDRWGSRWALAALSVLVALAGMVQAQAQVQTPVPFQTSAGVGTGAGFEDNDGNLAPEPPINFDWNSFSPVNWTGSAPYQSAMSATNGWEFTGVTDPTGVSNDSRIAMGPTTQDTNCPPVGTGNVNPQV